MKNPLQLTTIIMSILLLVSVTASAGQHGGDGKRLSGGAPDFNSNQRNEAEQSVRKRAEQEQGTSSGSIEQQRERIEMETEKRTRQESPASEASKNREQMRTTEEMHKEAGKGSDMTEPGRETSRKWWELWK